VRAAQDIADYVLIYRNQTLAVIEAKRRGLPDTEGVGRPGQEIRREAADPFRLLHQWRRRLSDRHDDRRGTVRHRISLPGRTLEPRLCRAEHIWRDRFAAIPCADKSDYWQAALLPGHRHPTLAESIVAGQDRILLILAAGTGKTFIAFQLAWKLFQSR